MQESEWLHNCNNEFTCSYIITIYDLPDGGLLKIGGGGGGGERDGEIHKGG